MLVFQGPNLCRHATESEHPLKTCFIEGKRQQQGNQEGIYWGFPLDLTTLCIEIVVEQPAITIKTEQKFLPSRWRGRTEGSIYWAAVKEAISSY